LVSDFWIFGRIGEKRARWAYPFRTLIKSGVMVISGSDCPVEKIDPLLGISAAVNRVNFPEESLTMEDALKTYTLNAAYASFDEVRKGTIERGRFADLTVLSDDLLEIPANKFPRVSVEMTIIDGRVVYASGNFRRHLD
jgi:predicted amidohydrolase YtcJ